MSITAAIRKAAPKTAGVSIAGIIILNAARLNGADTAEIATIGIGTGYATAATGLVAFAYHALRQLAQDRRRLTPPTADAQQAEPFTTVETRRRSITMTTRTARQSDGFTSMFQAIVRNPAISIEDFEHALDQMTVAGVIDALTNEERMTASPADRGVKVLRQGDVTYQAYAYLSPQGKLQIWMEAIRPGPEPAILATARFSWNHVEETPETAAAHEEHARRVRELRRPAGSD